MPLNEALRRKTAAQGTGIDRTGSGHSLGSLLEDVPIGIILEVPAAALSLDQLGAEVDFFSVGTNDLAQYFFAADRETPSVSGLCNQSSSSFIRLLRRIIDEVRAAGKWIRVCGDMASDMRYLPLFLGFRSR